MNRWAIVKDALSTNRIGMLFPAFLRVCSSLCVRQPDKQGKNVPQTMTLISLAAVLLIFILGKALAPSSASPKSKLATFAKFLYSAMLLASLAAAAFSFAGYDEAHSSFAYRNAARERLCVVGTACGGVFALSGIVGILFLIFRKRVIWIVSLLASLGSVASVPTWIQAGQETLKDAKRRGGDWAGLNELSSMIDGIWVPSFLCFLAVIGLICVFCLRPPVNALKN
jgi:hypothetical protein